MSDNGNNFKIVDYSVLPYRLLHMYNVHKVRGLITLSPVCLPNNFLLSFGNTNNLAQKLDRIMCKHLQCQQKFYFIFLFDVVCVAMSFCFVGNYPAEDVSSSYKMIGNVCRHYQYKSDLISDTFLESQQESIFRNTKMHFKLLLVGCIIASISVAQVSWHTFI